MARQLQLLCVALLLPLLPVCSDDNGPGDPDAGDGATLDASDGALADAGDGGSEDARLDATLDSGVDSSTSDASHFTVIELPPPGTTDIIGISNAGNYVAYAELTQNATQSAEVFYFDLMLLQEFQLTSHPGVQASPWVFGEEIVWSDGRFAPTVNDPPIELFSYNVLTGAETIVTDSGYLNLWPIFNQSHIIFETSEDCLEDGEKNLVLMHRQTGDRTTLAFWDQYVETYDLGGHYAAWDSYAVDNQSDHDVFVHDISTGVTFRIDSTIPGFQRKANTDGRYVVWMDPRNGDYDIYAYDLTTDQETNLTAHPAQQWLGLVQGGIVSFIDHRDCQNTIHGTRHLYIHEIATGVRRQITFDCQIWGPLWVDSGWFVFTKTTGSSMEKKIYALDLVANGLMDANGHLIAE